MESFDGFLEQQLNEVGGEILNALKTRTARSIAKGPDKLAAKFGGKEAEGRLMLADAVENLEDDFKKYCAHQQINPQMVTAEDFFAFLVSLGMNIPQETIDAKIYGSSAAGEAPSAHEIAELSDTVVHGLESNADITSALNSFAHFAKSGGADAKMAVKSLWTIARDHSSQLGKLRPVLQFCGRHLDASKLSMLITNTAKAMLSAKGAGAKTAGGAAGEAKVDPKVTNNLDVGEVDIDLNGLTKGWAYKPFVDELARYGLSKAAAQSCMDKLAKLTPEGAVPASDIIDDKFSKNQCINLCRILLQQYRPAGGSQKLLADFMKHFAGKPSFIGNVKTLLADTKGAKDEATGKTRRFYDGTKFNNVLAAEITEEATSAHMLTALLHQVRKDGLL